MKRLFLLILSIPFLAKITFFKPQTTIKALKFTTYSVTGTLFNIGRDQTEWALNIIRTIHNVCVFSSNTDGAILLTPRRKHNSYFPSSTGINFYYRDILTYTY